ncbi:hypothetical protein TcWFU_003912 [Taenia crassiceps]|uniref:Uncharacterized protein n=1 Tax=Taenia crassiceps TaxID=6207 RepID=A0ABR4Q202_9CEST
MHLASRVGYSCYIGLTITGDSCKPWSGSRLGPPIIEKCCRWHINTVAHPARPLVRGPAVCRVLEDA